MMLQRFISLGLSLIMTMSSLNFAFAVETLNKTQEELLEVPEQGDDIMPNDVILSDAAMEIDIAALSDTNDMTVTYAVDGGNIYIDILTGYITKCDSCIKIVKVPSSIDNVDIIGISDSAFSNSAVTSIEIPYGVKCIGSKAFMNCGELMEVKIPASVDSIGESAFVGCSKLENIYVDKDNNTYTSDLGVLYNKDMTVLICFPAGNNGDWSSHSYGSNLYGSRVFVIPKTVKHIADMAFYGNKKLNKISLFYAEYIGYSAFAECDALKEVVIENIEAINEKAFYHCAYLESVWLESGIKYIEDRAFTNCWNLTNIDIPYSVTKIGAYAFAGCSSIKRITLPNHLEYIGDDAFEGCIQLIGDEDATSSYLTIPYNVSHIGYWAFKDCTCLEYVEIPYSVSSIAGGNLPSFKDCNNLKTVFCYIGTAADNKSIYPATTQIEYIDDFLEYLTIPYGEKNGTFYYNPLKGEIVEFCEEDPYGLDDKKFDLNVPNIINGTEIKSIGYAAFSGCSHIEKIVLPPSVENIDDNAFECCKNLVEITIPQNVSNMGNDLFLDCNNLKTIYIYKQSFADNMLLYPNGISVVYISDDTIKGDMNGDGKATTADALVVARLAIGKVQNDELYSMCDYNKDGKVTTADALVLARYAIGKLSKL